MAHMCFMNILIIRFYKIKISLTFTSEFRIWLRNSIMVGNTSKKYEKHKAEKYEKENIFLMKYFISFYFFTLYIN